MPKTSQAPRAFTLVELLVVIAIIALLIGILVPVLGGAREATRKLQDASRVGGVIRSFKVWAGNNDSTYPLPSVLDVTDATVDPNGNPSFVKDTTSNIYSVLLFNDLLSPGDLISPSERNRQVQEDGDYNTANPDSAENPRYALWDPSFSGMPEGSQTSNNSYAHTTPFGPRFNDWNLSAGSDRAIVSNRGPTFTGSGNVVTVDDQTSINWDFDQDSITYNFYSPENVWQGNVGYNDASVRFVDDVAPPETRIVRDEDGDLLTVADNIFANEDDGGVTLGAERIGEGSSIYLRAFSNILPGMTDNRADATATTWDSQNFPGND